MAIDEKVLIERLEEKAFSVQTKQGVKEPSTHDAMMEKFSVLEIKEIVKDLAEEHNNGWIPCSERLPKEMETVLGCDWDGHCEIVRFYNDKIWGKTWKVWHGGDYRFEAIVAWQNLPAPYKKGE